MDMIGQISNRLSVCKTLIRERRLVTEILGPSLCANPVWDMLLDLYVADLEGRSLYIWPLSVAGNVPISSAHRKIDMMVREGLVVRRMDETDRRRVGIALAPSFRLALEMLLDKLAEIIVPPHHPTANKEHGK